MEIDIVVNNEYATAEIKDQDPIIAKVSNNNDVSEGKQMASGGDTAQALIKASATSYDTEWGDHNDIAGKQGGTTGEYYHITAAQNTVVGNTSGVNTGDEVVATGAEVDTGTNDTKMVTPKAMEDSSYAKTSAIPVKATGAEINTGTDDAKFATSKAIADSNVAFVSDIPVKASGAEVDTGTDDAKFVTPKAMEDSSYAKTSAIPVKASGAELAATTDDAKFATAKALDDAGISNWLINQVFS